MCSGGGYRSSLSPVDNLGRGENVLVVKAQFSVVCGQPGNGSAELQGYFTYRQSRYVVTCAGRVQAARQRRRKFAAGQGPAQHFGNSGVRHCVDADMYGGRSGE